MIILRDVYHIYDISRIFSVRENDKYFLVFNINDAELECETYDYLFTEVPLIQLEQLEQNKRPVRELIESNYTVLLRTKNPINTCELVNNTIELGEHEFRIADLIELEYCLPVPNTLLFYRGLK